MATLYVCENGAYREAHTDDVLGEARRVINRQFRVGAPVLDRRERIHAFLHLRVAPLEYEVFGLFYLDAHLRLIAVEELFRGSATSATVHADEVLKSVLRRNATAVMIYHNHPSGDPAPSPADELLTRRLQQLLELIHVRLVDHLVIGASVFSFSEAGLL